LLLFRVLSHRIQLPGSTREVDPESSAWRDKMWIIIPDDEPNRRVIHGLFFDEAHAILYGNDAFGPDRFEAIALTAYFQGQTIEFTDVHKDDTI